MKNLWTESESSSFHLEVENSIHLENSTERKIVLTVKEEVSSLRGFNMCQIGVKEEENGGNWREAMLEETLQGVSRTEKRHEPSKDQKHVRSTT